MSEWAPELSQPRQRPREFKWYWHKPTGDFHFWEMTNPENMNHDPVIEKRYPDFQWKDFHSGYAQAWPGKAPEWRWYGNVDDLPYEADDLVQQHLQNALQEATGSPQRAQNGLGGSQVASLRTADYQGWSNWDTWHTKLLIDNEQETQNESFRIVEQGLRAGQDEATITQALADWALRTVVGPHNKQAIQDAQEWNDIPPEERIDYRFENLKNENPQAADIVDGLGFGPDVSDTDPMIMEDHLINWHEIYESIKDDILENWRYEQNLDWRTEERPEWWPAQQPANQNPDSGTSGLTIPNEWISKVAGNEDRIIYHTGGGNSGVEYGSQEGRIPYLYDADRDLLHWGEEQQWHYDLRPNVEKWLAAQGLPPYAGTFIPGAIRPWSNGTMAHAVYDRYLPPNADQAHEIRNRLEQLVGHPVLEHFTPDSIMNQPWQTTTDDWLPKLGADSWKQQYHYRAASPDAKRMCETCSAFQGGKCHMFYQSNVEPEMVCDEWSSTWAPKTGSDWMADSADSWHGPGSVREFEVDVPGEAPGMGGIGHIPGEQNTLFRSPCWCDIGPTTPHEWSPICENGLHPTLQHEAREVSDDQRAPGWRTRVPFFLTPGGTFAMGNVGDEHWQIPDDPRQPQELLDYYNQIDPSYTPDDILHGEVWRDHQGQVNFDPDTGEYVAHWPMDWDTMRPKEWITPEMQQRVLDEAQRRWQQRTSSLTASPDHWVWLDGHVAFGGDHHDIAARLTREIGYDPNHSRYISNMIARGLQPEGHNIAVGTLKGGYPHIWTSTVDRNAVWDDVARSREEQMQKVAMGLRGDLPEGIQFTWEPNPQWSGQASGGHVGAFLNGVEIGGMSISDGRIAGVEVLPEYRRMGIATALARHYYEQTGDIPQHDWENQSFDGRQWAGWHDPEGLEEHKEQWGDMWEPDEDDSEMIERIRRAEENERKHLSWAPVDPQDPHYSQPAFDGDWWPR